MSNIDRSSTMHARAFHEALCLKLDIQPLQVLVFRTMPKFIEEPPTTSGMIFIDDTYILVFFDSRKDPFLKLLKTVAHETYHAFQVQKGLIHQVEDEWCYAGLSLKDLNRKPWNQRPFEIEAESFARSTISDYHKGVTYDKRRSSFKSEPHSQSSEPQALRSAVGGRRSKRVSQ